MHWIEWALGIVSAILVLAVGAISKAIINLPVNYVPRDQADTRFSELEGRLTDQIRAQEARQDGRFDRIDRALEKIDHKLDAKVDK